MKITWNELTVASDSLSTEDLLSEWGWLLRDAYEIVLISSLGDMFLEDARGNIHWLEAGAGRLSQIAGSFEEFQKLRQQSVHAQAWFRPQLVGDLMENGLRLCPGQCFGYKLPPALGGIMEPSNFEPTDLILHFSILGQMNRRAKELPEGTPIKSFTTDGTNE